METTDCPTKAELSDYLLGRVSLHLVEGIESHVGQCTECQAALADCDQSGDAVVVRLQQELLSEEFLAEPELQNALREVVNLASLARAKAKENEPQVVRVERVDEPLPEEPTQLGQYRLLRLLGKGGMGAVYLAEHTRLEMTVAVKVLSERRTDDPTAVARFDREMKAVGRLNHKNIVRATDAGEHAGRHYLAMEYVDGEDCQSILRRGMPLRIADACEIVRQVAIGLQCAHEHHLIHRDMKPSNIMLSRAGEVKVLDLGLARLMSQRDEVGLTDDFQVMGTADYIAPEQVVASDAGLQADIYSLGCTLYALLCGSPPFANYETAFQKLKAHDLEQPVAAHERRSEISEPLSQVVGRAISKPVADRFQSAAELAAALEPFAVGADLVALASLAGDVCSTGDTAPCNEYTTRMSPAEQSNRSIPPVAPIKRRGKGTWHFVILALAGVVGLLAALVLHFDTPMGSIVVEIRGAEVGASIMGEELIIEDRKTGNEYRLAIDSESLEQPLKPGNYTIRLVNEAAGLQLNTNRFQIVRDKQVVVSATLVPRTESAENETPSAVKDQVADSHTALERRMVKWGWEHEAIVSITDGQQYFATSEEIELPKEFWIHKIDFQRPMEFSEEDFTNLRNLPRLVELCFHNQVASDRFIEGLAALPELRLLEFRCLTESTVGLQRLSRLPLLGELRLKGAAVNDQLAVEASELTRIYSLGLEGPLVTDRSLKVIGNMKNVRNLSLLFSGISDEGLKHLEGMNDLEMLFLAYTSVSNEGVKHLLELRKLQWLNIANTTITDVGLQELSQMHWLNRLTLAGLDISDPGLIALQQITSLRTLQLENSSISDANLESLAALKQVTNMPVGNQLSAEGVRTLRLRLPKCRIDSFVIPY